MALSANAIRVSDLYPNACVIKTARLYNFNGKEMAIVQVNDNSTGKDDLNVAFDLRTSSGALMYATLVKRIGAVGNLFWSSTSKAEAVLDVYDYTIGTGTVITIPILVETSFYN